MRMIFIVVLIITGFTSAWGQSVKYGNNETSTYTDAQKSSDFTYLMWDRNDEGDGNFSNESTPKFFYWDNDDSKLHFLLDTGNMDQLNAKFASVAIDRKLKIDMAGTVEGESPGIVVSNASNDDFLYDNEYLHHYGFGFHGYGDGTSSFANPRNIYMSGYFGIDLFTGGAERMRINRNGNVGINTVNPTETLTVNGTAKAEEVIVEENIGADFVFEEGYDLPKLQEIESYIQKQKHLQRIPSAAEMKKNGVKVGDLQMKLLQKIEELTLYVIQLEKKDKAKESRIEKLEQELQALKKKQ